MSISPENIHLELIRQAIEQGRAVQLEYFSPGSGQFTERTIEPTKTVHEDNTWRVKAYCRLRQDNREFRLDRMSKPRFADEV